MSRWDDPCVEWVMGTLKRRSVLLSALPAAVACAHRSRDPGTRANQRIVIVGGGLSGLAAAHGLVKLGHQVTVLEADDRPGGRILTLRKPFTDGLFVEAGAKHVVGDPDLLAFIQEMGVGLARAPARPKLPDARVLKGHRFREDQPPPALAAPLARERELGFGALRRYLAASSEIGDPRAPGWPSEPARAFDAVSFERFLLDRGASSDLVNSLRGSDITPEPDSLSALNVLRDWYSIGQEMKLKSPGRIQGGSDRLPRAAATKLGDRVVQGAVVKRIENHAAGARVTFVRQGQTVTLAADQVVIAVPFTLLRQIAIDPPLQEAKRRAIETMRYASVTRGYLQTSDRPWMARGESGRVNTDLAIRSVREESEFATGSAAVLGTYITGAESRRLAALDDRERLRQFQAEMDIAHPGLTGHTVAAVTHCWDRAPFARGAYAMFGPGEMTAILPVASTPEGRLHFAGCHTSHRPGFMHGAIASAKRVVLEIAGR